MAKKQNGTTYDSDTPPAATKKAGKSKALVTMASLENLYAKSAKAAVAAAPVAEGAPRISTKSEMFSVGETILPDPLVVIVVAWSLQNVWYEQPYDSDNPSPPSCFAVGPALELDEEGKPVPGTGETAMVAHPTSPNIQGGPNHECASCELNKFGSAEIGRGKACSNSIQLAVVMADDPAFKTDDELRYATLSLSPTSLGLWGKFVKQLDAVEHRPPWGVVVSLSFNKTDKNERMRKAVKVVNYEPITSVAVAQKVIDLHDRLIESRELVRPLPVDVGGGEPVAARGRKPTKAKTKVAPGGGEPPPRAKRGAPTRAARF